MSINLEHVVRSYASRENGFGTTFVTYISPVEEGSEEESGNLTISARTNMRTTEIRGATWQINMKSDWVETERVETEVTVTNPDDPTQTATFKVPKSISIQDRVKQLLYKWHFSWPNADNSAIMAAGSSGTFDGSTIQSVTPSSDISGLTGSSVAPIDTGD